MRCQLTYSQTSGTRGSLVSRLASVTLQEVKGRLGPDKEMLSDYVQDAQCLHTQDLQ